MLYEVLLLVLLLVSLVVVYIMMLANSLAFFTYRSVV